LCLSVTLGKGEATPRTSVPRRSLQESKIVQSGKAEPFRTSDGKAEEDLFYGRRRSLLRD
ncbi:MAG: hypothetical protein M3R67_08265, partial [Acidobacteriota bacterium]|nr:hypothetical protein [Acidobacteriota bacterium]